MYRPYSENNTFAIYSVTARKPHPGDVQTEIRRRRRRDRQGKTRPGPQPRRLDRPGRWVHAGRRRLRARRRCGQNGCRARGGSVVRVGRVRVRIRG